jgi:hypothetical protein
MEPSPGFEPGTPSLPWRCSTPELRWRNKLLVVQGVGFEPTKA